MQIRFSFLIGSILVQAQILDFEPGILRGQDAVCQAAIGSPSGELVIKPDDEGQRSLRGDGCFEHIVSIDEKLDCILLPDQLVIVPDGWVNIDRGGVLFDYF